MEFVEIVSGTFSLRNHFPINYSEHKINDKRLREMINTNEIIVSTDKNKLDIQIIHTFLTQSYWAKGRTIEQVKASIENSMCFGIYLNEEQIGFARVLSDTVVFAYLMDVFILEKYRGKGYAKILLGQIINYPELKYVGKWFLATRDAHHFYQQFGFKEITHPEKYMEK